MTFEEAMRRWEKLQLGNSRDDAIAKSVYHIMGLSAVGSLRALYSYNELVTSEIAISTMQRQFAQAVEEAMQEVPRPRGAL